MNKHTVLVYGSLRKGKHNHSYFLKDAALLGQGKVKGFSMFSLGAFPFITPSEDDAIVAEAYEVDDAGLSSLDRLEGYPSFYNRMEVGMEDSELRGWIYYMDKPKTSSPYVEGGDWMKQ